MADNSMLLLVHGEVTDADVDVFDREAEFIERTMVHVVRDFPTVRLTSSLLASHRLASPRLAAPRITSHHIASRCIASLRRTGWCMSAESGDGARHDEGRRRIRLYRRRKRGRDLDSAQATARLGRRGHSRW
jgi:hypothetical protein